jgi:hypothetical protein
VPDGTSYGARDWVWFAAVPQIQIEYPQRLQSPAEAEAFYRRLGDERVGVRGFRTNDPRRIDRLVEAIDPAHDSTVHFETGLIDARGWARLEALATAPVEYLDVHAGGANLRIWPAQAKVYARLPFDGVDGVSEAFGAPLRAGMNQRGDATIAIDPVVGYPLAVALTTPDRAVALRMFRALGDAQLSRGHVSRASEAAKHALAPFLHDLGATVHVTLDLQLELARELSTVCPDLRHDWQASMVHVDFPDGRIHGFLRTPQTSEQDREQWLARVRHAVPGAPDRG